MNKHNYRRIGAYVLMLASAISIACQYALQGIFASGHPTTDLPSWFWVADWTFWALRAVIEAVVILYLFETDTENKAHRRLLNVFEVSLIGLIVLTVAPAIRAQGLGLAMPNSVSPLMFTAWCVGLAAYTPLMMGGLATALRVQPGSEDSVPLSQLDAEKAKLKLVQDEVARLRKEAAESNAAHEQTVQTLQELSRRFTRLRSPETTASATAFITALREVVYDNGSMPETGKVAEALKVSRQTVDKALSMVEKDQ